MDINVSHIVRYPQLGNGLAASSNLGAGDVIIRIKEPYLILAEKAALDRVCSQCLYEKSPLKRCTGCKTVQYCSTTCQSVAWKSIHKVECAIYKKLPAIPPTPVRGLMNLLIRKELGKPSDSQWAGLEGHTASLQKYQRWDEILLQAKASVEFTNSAESCIEAAVNVLCRMVTNAFRVTLSDNTPIGLCFEPVISLANHSCTPNAVIVFNGRGIELRALNSIEKGKQIFIAYVDPTQTKEVRRDELKTRYFFDCECEKCVTDDGPYAAFLKASPNHFPKLGLFIDPKDSTEFARKWVNESFNPSTTPNVQSLVPSRGATTSPNLQSILTNIQIHQFANPPNPTLLYDHYLSYLDSSHYVPALILLLFIYLNCDIYSYPQPHHPIRVIRLYTIARLLKQVASLNDDELTLGIESFPRAQALLNSIDLISTIQVLLIITSSLATLSHGADSAFCKEVCEELAEVEGVQRQRGSVGARLREWGLNEDEEGDGKEYARKIFEGLRALGGFGLGVIQKSNV